MNAVPGAVPCGHILDYARLFLVLQASLLALCILEESLETFSILRSNILSGFLILLLDIFTSILRVPIRCLSCLGLCQLAVADRFKEFVLCSLRTLGVRSATDIKLSSLEAQMTSLSDELAHSRESKLEFEMQNSRLQAKYSQAQGELQKLRRKTAIDSGVETARLQEALEASQGECDILRQEMAALSKQMATEKSTLRGILKDAQSQWKKEVAEVTVERDDLRRLCIEHQTQTFAIRADFSNANANLQLARQELASVREDARVLEIKRYNTIRALALALVLLWRLSYILGVRLAGALRVKAALLSRFKTLSNKKVQARREYLRVQNLNQDLQGQLAAETTGRADEAASAVKWHAEYYKSVKARDRAAVKFKTFQRFALQRYSDTTTKLLAALLILWRQNTILSAHLAETQALARALQISAVEADETRAATDDEAFQYDNLHPNGFAFLSRDEANAVYAVQYRKYCQTLRDYQQFVESCSATISDDTAKEALQESYRTLQALHEQVTAERDVALSTLETLKAEQRDLQVKLGHGTKEQRVMAHQLEEAHRTAKKASESSLIKSHERVQTLEQQCASKEDSLRDLEAKLVEVEEKLYTSDSKAQLLRTTLKELEATRTALEGRNKDTEKQLADTVKRLQNTEVAAHQLREHASDLDVLRRGLLEQGQKTKEELLDTRKKLEESTATAFALRIRVVELDDLRRTSEGRTVELEKGISDTGTKLRNAENLAGQLNVRIARSDSGRRAAEKHSLQVESQLLDVKKRLQDSERSFGRSVARIRNLEERLSTSTSATKDLQSDLQSSYKTHKSLVIALASLGIARNQDRAKWIEVNTRAVSLGERLCRLSKTCDALNSVDGYYRQMLMENVHLSRMDLSAALTDDSGRSEQKSPQPAQKVPRSRTPSVVPKTAASDPAPTKVHPPSAVPRCRRPTSGDVALGVPSRRSKLTKTPRVSSESDTDEDEQPSIKPQIRSRTRSARARPAVILQTCQAEPAHSVTHRGVQTESVVPRTESKPSSNHHPAVASSVMSSAPVSPPVSGLSSLPDSDVDVFRPAIREALAEIHSGAYAYESMKNRRQSGAHSSAPRGWGLTPPRHDFNTAGASVTPDPTQSEIPLLRKKPTALLQMSLPQTPSPSSGHKSRYP